MSFHSCVTSYPELSGVSSEQLFIGLYLGIHHCHPPFIIMMCLLMQLQTSRSARFHHIPLHSFRPCPAFLTSTYLHLSDPSPPLSSNSVHLSCPPLTPHFSIKGLLYSLCTLSDKLTKFTPYSLSLSPVQHSCPRHNFGVPLWLWTSSTGLLWNLRHSLEPLPLK
jgi:hypothetical protein